MKKDYIGIDLGSANTLIYSSFKDSIVYHEPTCIALDLVSKEVKEIGFLASKLAGKTPYHYSVIYPVEHGIVEDDEAAFLYLDTVLKSLKLDRRKGHDTIIFTAPSNTGKANKRTLLQLGKKLGAKEVIIESQAKIAALGCGDSVFAPTATLLCQIGAGVSDVCCLSLGEIVYASSTFIAGLTFDEAIRRYMIQNQHLSIGLKSAEYLKMRVGSVASLPENRLAEVKGKDTMTSLPSSIVVSSGGIKNALIPLANFISLKISDVIASLPEELIADLKSSGLILSGGGALLSGMRDYLQNLLSIPVRLADKPLEVTLEGFRSYSKILEEKSPK